MPGLPAPQVLVARVAALRTRIQQHKVAIRRTRELLHEDAAALADLEAACRDRGICITTVQVPSSHHSEA